MMYNYPFFSFPHFRRYPNYYNVKPPHVSPPHATEPKPSVENKESKSDDEEFFELFGFKFYNDDLLLLGLIFFLYKEDVKDQYLFFALILLLLS